MKFRVKPAHRRGNAGVGGDGGIVGGGIMSLACLFCLSSSMLMMSSVAALSEMEVLYHVHANLNGNNWDSKWDVDSGDICSEEAYPGVKCNSAGKITEIHLKDNNLAGSISPYVYTLPHLKHLDFSKNRITNAGWDRLSPEIVGDSAIADIEVMELTNNLISTVAGVSKLKGSLTGLHMTYNNLKGTIPSELFQLPLLEILAISENKLSGTIDKHLGNLTNLLEFYCYGNKLTGTIPSEIGHLTKMQVLTFSENLLTGTLPSTLKNMGNLQTFSVHNNDPDTGTHTGKLPKFDQHPYLNEIYLDGNAFTGTIPSDFLKSFNGSLGETVTISLENNLLTGTIPKEFLKFDSLLLNVIGNKIEGYGTGICDDESNDDKINGWMNGMVEMFGCDAILCPVDTYSDTGRQEEAQTMCEPCNAGTNGLMGATTCDGATVVNGTADELEILVEFYLALNGPQWIDVGGWTAFAEMESPMDLTLPSYQGLAISPCVGFSGVVCNDDKSIFEISLPNNGLEGLVPSSFFNLPNLHHLDLSGNEIRLDRDFGFGDIGKAPMLKKVDLSSNDIQKFSGLGAATSLEELIVNDAYFFSAIDTELYQLTGLKVLRLKYSGLKGKITEGISALSILKELDLYGNQLTGSIPSEIGLMTRLWHVDLSENDFSGHLPSDAIAKLLNLQKFHVHQSGKEGNGLTGRLPSFKHQTLLHMLSLNSNSMTGTIPSDFLSGIADVDQLMAIDIGYNKFHGTVPDTLSRFTNMRLLAMKNEITKVDPALCTLTGWINGEVGKIITAGGNGCDAILCPVGTYNTYGRQTSGGDGACLSCPDGKFAGQTGCIGITDESLTTEKRIIDKIYVETGGSNWTKGKNWETGAICSYEGITCASNSTNEGVEEINLSGFGLINNIPTEIYRLSSLTKVDFSNNVVGLSFDGISNAASLEEIVISFADLSNVDGISGAPALKKLRISHNTFPKGSIPDELYSIDTLELLDISYNGFSGSLPGDLTNLVNLQELYAGSNDITGTIPDEIAELSVLTSLVLSANRMSGEIPNSLEDIAPLRELHLNGQRDFGGFTGPIPDFNSSLHLHVIDFSKNSLTGSIPTSFLALVRSSASHDVYAYDTIDLSSNQITGALPESWNDFVGLFANVAGNRITDVPDVLCDDDNEFMDNLVGNLTTNKCDAILCPPGTSHPVGRQTDASVPCQPCPGTTIEERELQAPYYGMFKCQAISGERSTLEQIYELIFQKGKSTDTYWMSEQPICSWYGVSCADKTDETGVAEIKLESNHLETTESDIVSALFFSLPSLKKLDLRGNDNLLLNLDNVPTQLESLQLSATGLKSLAGIGRAINLKELHVTDNDMTGLFPEEIFNLTALEKLYLSFNKYSGTLPTQIGELISLREFYAYTNNMSGVLPTELGNLVNIENLVIGKNNFEGNLPTQLNKLVNLREFSVYYNEKMTGNILDFSEATKLEKLDLEGNGFSGQIPSSFLSGLDADFIADSDNEIVLHLADNALTGTIPVELSKIANLYLDIVGNEFTEVPASFCKEEQSLWMNGKVGDLLKSTPCYAIACPVNTASETGRMHSDDDEECAPCASDESAPHVGSKKCRSEHDEYSALKSFYKATKGDSWLQNENWLDNTKPLCTWYGIECAGDSLDNHTITGIDLSANSLNGTMPHEIWELPSLQSLNLKENHLYMHFNNIHLAKKLQLLYISDIDIGSIDRIGTAPALTELHLTANDLTGSLPDDFYELADTLEHLYIAYNSFTGTLSTEFGKFTKLIDFYAYDNEFVGGIPNEFAAMKNLENFVVAENKLSGTISEDFSYMPKLKLFSAYRRLKPGPKLTGVLPSFSNVPNLRGLYLDYNHLVGTIPSSFLQASLKSELITISHNLLTGEVPLELAHLSGINLQMEGNKLTDFDERFCENLDWMDGAVTDFGCDALMCSPGYHSIYGRQNSTDSKCKLCPTSTNSTPSPYWGSISCDGLVNDKEILELLYSETKGNNWKNNENWLKTDDICTWYGVECRDGVSVQAIRLGSNNLVGTPPKQLFHLKQLHTLWLNSNPISFSFDGIDKAQNLIDLRLDATGLKDTFGVGEAKTLIKLNLRYNQISGEFPQELLNLAKLESLDLTDNSLTGSLPDSWEKAINLIELRLGSNKFSGNLASFNDLGNILRLDLSENDLVGAIPDDFLDMVSGRKSILVDLSSNKLSGVVPHHIDRLDRLVIYLRDNNFKQLPATLCDLNNHDWNMQTVGMFGCDALMCPPRTANYHGRKSADSEQCLKCESNTDLFGQILCNGSPVEASSSLLLVIGPITMYVLGGVLLIQLFMF